MHKLLVLLDVDHLGQRDQLFEGVAVQRVYLLNVRVGDNNKGQGLDVQEAAREADAELALHVLRHGDQTLICHVRARREQFVDREPMDGHLRVPLHSRVVKIRPVPRLMRTQTLGQVCPDTPSLRLIPRRYRTRLPPQNPGLSAIHIRQRGEGVAPYAGPGPGRHVRQTLFMADLVSFFFGHENWKDRRGLATTTGCVVLRGARCAWRGWQRSPARRRHSIFPALRRWTTAPARP